MPNAYASPSAVQRFYDNNGNPLYGGFLYTYAAGTTTPTAVYTDSTASQAYLNPIQLNARGEPPNGGPFLLPGVGYKFLVTDSSGNTIPPYPIDNIYSQPSVTTSGQFTGTATGFTTTVTTTVNYTLSSNAVDVTVGPMSGTSNANTMTLGGIPTLLQPPTLTQAVSVPFLFLGGLTLPVWMIINAASSSWTFGFGPNQNSWPSTGQKGINFAFCFSYLLL